MYYFEGPISQLTFDLIDAYNTMLVLFSPEVPYPPVGGVGCELFWMSSNYLYIATAETIICTEYISVSKSLNIKICQYSNPLTIVNAG